MFDELKREIEERIAMGDFGRALERIAESSGQTISVEQATSLRRIVELALQDYQDSEANIKNGNSEDL